MELHPVTRKGANYVVEGWDFVPDREFKTQAEAVAYSQELEKDILELLSIETADGSTLGDALVKEFCATSSASSQR